MLLSRFEIQGHSMEPALLQGEIVLVSSIPYLFFKPQIGDIIVFKRNEKAFLKRIIKIEEEKYFVKGDNSRDSLDSRKLGWIEKREIGGKVIFKIPNYSNF